MLLLELARQTGGQAMKAPGDAFLFGITHHLHDAFGIQHSTIQIETDPDSSCALAPDHVV